MAVAEREELANRLKPDGTGMPVVLTVLALVIAPVAGGMMPMLICRMFLIVVRQSQAPCAAQKSVLVRF